MARITVVRGGGYADILRAYVIEVNGEAVGRIRRKSALEIEVPAGEVTLGARIDWCRAEPLELLLRPGGMAHVRVMNTHGAWKAGYAITAGAWDYLTLIREGRA